MTYQATDTLSAFNMGRVISRAFGMMFGNFWKLLGLCLLALVVSFVITLMGAMAVSVGGQSSASVVAGAVTIANLVIMVLQFAFVWGAITYAGIAHLEGRPAGFGECIAHGLRTMVPMTGLFILSIIVITASYAVFVVPAIILNVIWAVTAQALTIEKLGVFAAFSRSLDLTQNNRLAIFGLQLLVGIGNVMFLGAALMLFAGLMAASGIDQVRPRNPSTELATGIYLIVGGGLVYLATFVVSIMANACLQTSLYAELRQIKEGAITPASVFE